MNLNDRIEQVDLKARQLALKMDHLKERNEKLVGENRNLQAKLDRAIDMIADMQEKLESSEASLSKKRETDPKEIKDLRKKIDTSIKEIDGCIEWLEKT